MNTIIFDQAEYELSYTQMNMVGDELNYICEMMKSIECQIEEDAGDTLYYREQLYQLRLECERIIESVNELRITSKRVKEIYEETEAKNLKLVRSLPKSTWDETSFKMKPFDFRKFVLPIIIPGRPWKSSLSMLISPQIKHESWVLQSLQNIL